MAGKKPLPDYAKYSALGIQMALFIVICTFLGRFADQKIAFHFPVFTITGLIIGVFGAMYYMIGQFK